MNSSFTLCRIRSSDSGGYEDICLLEYSVVQSVEIYPHFWRNISPPYRRISQARNQREACRKFCLAYSSTTFLRKAVNFQRITRHYIQTTELFLMYPFKLHTQLISSFLIVRLSGEWYKLWGCRQIADIYL
jgi:hypothetical protein